MPGSCIGNSLSYDVLSTEDACLEKCKENGSCNWFTYDEFDGACVLLTECFNLDQNGCGTCWSGQVQCGDRQSDFPRYFAFFVIA